MQRMSAADYVAPQSKPGEPKRKFGNVHTTYNGRKYHSKKEALWAAHLDRLHHAGTITGWVPQQPRFRLCVNPETGKELTYTADFRVLLPDGRELVLDAKGFDTAESRLRRAIVHDKYGIRVLTVWADFMATLDLK